MYMFSQYLKKSTRKPEPNNLTVYQGSVFSVVHAALVGWHHVFDVNESIFTSVLFEQFECLLDQVSQDESFTLTVLDFVSKVDVAGLVQVEDGQYLSVVGHECFSDGV